MADLAKIFMPRATPRSPAAAAAPHVSASGLGDPQASAVLDPVSDAVTQLALIQAYFAVVSAGGTPTASQYAAATAAIGAIGADLRSLQIQPEPPPGSKLWVSGTVAAALAGTAALAGGAVGYFARGSKGK
jgi:hypothetical protein